MDLDELYVEVEPGDGFVGKVVDFYEPTGGIAAYLTLRFEGAGRAVIGSALKPSLRTTNRRQP